MNPSLFFIGLAIGGSVAAIGGFIDYLLHLKRNQEPRPGLPGCLVYAVGGLVLAGICALIISLVTTGSLLPALVMGAGVLAGFYGGFIVLIGLWFLIDRQHNQRAEINTLPSDQSIS